MRKILNVRIGWCTLGLTDYQINCTIASTERISFLTKHNLNYLLTVFKMKLRSRLALMAFFSLIPLIIFSGLAAKRLSDGMHENALIAMKKTAHATALIVDRELKGALASVTVLSRSPFISEGQWKQFYEQAKAATESDSGWVVLYSPEGKQIINTRLPYGAPLPTRPSPDELIKVISTNQPRISGLTWGTVLKRNVVFVDVPIQTADGLHYVLSQAFFADYFDVAFKGRTIPATWIVSVFDQNGITIGRSVRAQEFVGKPAKPSTLKAIQSHSDTILRQFNRENTEVYNVITHSELSAWAVSVGVPVDEIDSQVRDAGYLAMGGLVLAILAALVSAGVIGRKLANAIELAAASSLRLGRSEELPAMQPSGVLEIDHLQHAIVDTATKLKNEELRRKSAEAINAQLLVSEHAARQAAELENKRKDEFLALLGHELRNPLGAITSAISLLKIKAADDAAILRPANIIHRQSEHLRKILDDLLDLSRVIYGKVQLEMQVTDLGSLITSSVNTMLETSKFSKHDFSYSSESLMVHVDVTRIEQVFSNLIENAVKYTDGGGSINVSVRRENDMALLSVVDSGIGIAPDLLPFIFDLFVQADSTLARTKGGMGLGLSLVRKLVALHGGTVVVHCDGVGKGCSFDVRLPLQEVEASQAIHSKDEIEDSLFGHTILLVEDQNDLREMQQALLTELGLIVWTAANGKDALKIAAQREPQVALIDIGLPEMSGYEIAAAMRSHTKTASIKLIALTGYGLEQDKALATEAGFHHHLTKPLRIEELKKCLKLLFA